MCIIAGQHTVSPSWLQLPKLTVRVRFPSPALRGHRGSLAAEPRKSRPTRAGTFCFCGRVRHVPDCPDRRRPRNCPVWGREPPSCLVAPVVDCRSKGAPTRRPSMRRRSPFWRNAGGATSVTSCRSLVQHGAGMDPSHHHDDAANSGEQGRGDEQAAGRDACTARERGGRGICRGGPPAVRGVAQIVAGTGARD